MRECHGTYWSLVRKAGSTAGNFEQEGILSRAQQQKSIIEGSLAYRVQSPVASPQDPLETGEDSGLEISHQIFHEENLLLVSARCPVFVLLISAFRSVLGNVKGRVGADEFFSLRVNC